MSIGTYPPQEQSLTVPLPLAQGGTSATTAAQARTNLGLGSMAQQNASAVAITGGSASFSTTLTVFGQATLSNTLINDVLVVGPGGPSGWGGRQQVRFTRGSQPGLSLRPDVDTGGTGTILFLNSADSPVGTITTSSTVTAYNTTSDVRLKHAIEKLVGSLDVIRVLNPVSFLWKANDTYGEGFRADELQQVIPQAVTGEPDALNEDGSIMPQGVDYGKVVPRLVGAMQELLLRVEALEARLA